MAPGSDPEHWLYRLDSQEWLSAADNELAHAFAALRAKRRREGITYARRAGGMALNAVLVCSLDERYGRSYVDHLRALAQDVSAPAPVRTAATALMQAPMQTDVVVLGVGTVELADAAAVVVTYARERVGG